MGINTSKLISNSNSFNHHPAGMMGASTLSISGLQKVASSSADSSTSDISTAPYDKNGITIRGKTLVALLDGVKERRRHEVEGIESRIRRNTGWAHSLCGLHNSRVRGGARGLGGRLGDTVFSGSGGQIGGDKHNQKGGKALEDLNAMKKRIDEMVRDCTAVYHAKTAPFSSLDDDPSKELSLRGGEKRSTTSMKGSKFPPVSRGDALLHRLNRRESCTAGDSCSAGGDSLPPACVQRPARTCQEQLSREIVFCTKEILYDRIILKRLLPRQLRINRLVSYGGLLAQLPDDRHDEEGGSERSAEPARNNNP